MAYFVKRDSLHCNVRIICPLIQLKFVKTPNRKEAR